MSKTAQSKKSGATSSDIPDLLKNANAAMEDEEWRESLLNFEKVLTLAKGKSSEPYQMKALEGMAQINFKLNSYNEASRLFQECLDLCYSHNDKSLERRCYSGLGICYVMMAMPKDAAQQLQYATTLQEKEVKENPTSRKQFDILMDCYIDIAKTMESINQVEDALKYYVKVACKGFIALNPRKGFDERKAMFHLAKTYKCMNFDSIEAELRLWRVLAYESITALKSKTSDLDSQEHSSESVGSSG